MRKQLISLGIIAVLILISGIWFGSQEKSGAQKDAFAAITPNTPLFLTISDLTDFYSKTTSGNPLFEDIKSFFPESHLFPAGTDSIIPGLKYLQKLSNNKGGVLALQTSGANKLDFMLCVKNEEGANLDDFGQFFEQSPGFKKGGLKSYEGERVQEIFIDSIQSFVSFPEDIFLWSQSEILIQNALRHLKTGENAWNTSAFKKLKKTNGAFADANIYLHPNSIFSELDFPLSAKGKKQQFWSKNFANLIAADITLRPNEFLWNGFAYASDSSAYYLNTFKGQKPKSHQFLSLIPASAIFFKYFGLSVPELFLNKQIDHRKHLNKGFPFEKWLIDWKKNEKRPPIETLKPWIGDEWTVFCTTPGKEPLTEHFFAIIELEDPTDFKAWSEKHCKQVAPLQNKNERVLQFKLKNLLPNLLGEAFAQFQNPFVLVKENHLYIFNNRSEMLRNIASINAGITIEESPGFQSFQNNVSSQSNLLVYMNPAGSTDFLLPYLSSTTQKMLTGNKENLQNIESLGYQFSFSKNELYYFNAFIRHNPFRANQPFALWEKELDTTLVWGPHYFENHYSGNREVLVQTANNELILFGTTGKELWKTSLKGKVISDLFQVDGFKNGKFQILVHTEDQIYLIDRLGRMVEKAPFILPEKATASGSLFDYDNNKTYRLVVPTEKGLFNFDIFGQKIKGWQAGTVEGNVSANPRHIRIRTRDYILAINDAGKPYLLSRRGDIRQATEFNVIDFDPANRFIHFNGKTALESGIVYRDKAGKLRSHKFNGRNDLIYTQPVEENWIYLDINKDGKEDFIFQSDKAIYAKVSGKELEKIKTLSDKEQLNSHLIFLKNQWNYAVLTPSKNKIELFPLNGNGNQNAPLMGASQFTPTELFSNGGIGFSTTDRKKKISTYVLN